MEKKILFHITADPWSISAFKIIDMITNTCNTCNRKIELTSSIITKEKNMIEISAYCNQCNTFTVRHIFCITD